MAHLPALVAVLALALGACAGGTADDGGALDVVASFYPLEYAAERVGGGAIEVDGLTPSGVEPHDLELAPSQIRALAAADLVVYAGRGFQPAVEDAVAGLDEARQLDVLEGAELLPGVEGQEEDGLVEDPHVWLDPARMADVAERIATRLGEIDPANAETYAANAAEFRRELSDLDGDFEGGLRSCRSRAFVTSHAAFGYLAARYGLEQVSVAGVDPEAEPSPRRLADVARFVADHDVRVIFFEELASPDLAETLARETGATTDVLSPLETEPERGDYVGEMRRNLERLRVALDCD